MSKVLPILFNTDMVRAILDGRKTVTRRLVNPQPPYDVQCLLGYCTDGHKSEIGKIAFGSHECGGKMVFCKPPYQAGDILYVRETWSEVETVDGVPFYIYKADHSAIYADANHGFEKWHPSIHMPKEAARIWLKVKDVRVERLQDITEEQAKAEGIREYSKDGKLWKYAVTDDWWISYHHKYRKFFVGSWWQDMPRTAKEAFHHLWNSTLGRRDTPEWYANNWSGNPWVCVIEFERCEKPEGR